MTNKNHFQRALVTVVCLFAWTHASFVGSQEQKQSATLAGKRCPMFKVMQHPGYSTYYAVQCPGMTNPSSLDAPDTNSLGCSSLYCQPTIVKEGKSKSHSFDSDLSDLGNDGDPDGNRPKYDPDPKTEPQCDRKKHFVIKYAFKNNSKISVYAQVVLIKVKKTGYAGRFIAVGHEIEAPAAGVPVRQITNLDDVTREGKHCHEVVVDLIPYQITTYKGTAEDPE